MNSAASSPRSPLIAGLLSFFCVGLGHIYVGQVRRGLELFLLWSIFCAPFAYSVALMRFTPWGMWILFFLPAVAVAITIYAVIDSRRIAKILDEFQPQTVHRASIYALFLVFSLSFTLPVLALIRQNYLEAFYLPSASMSPSLLNGDRVLVTKDHPPTWVPHRGQVIVFRNPDDRSALYVMRVIGLPGDRVNVSQGRVTINGQRLDQRPVETPLGTDVMEEQNDNSYRVAMHAQEPPSLPDVDMTLEKGHLFVLGDNRFRARDSRSFGAIPLGDVVGPVRFIFWPAQSWSRFGSLDVSD